jgi:drug/metabolite transporter (DMT)-like permease
MRSGLDRATLVAFLGSVLFGGTNFVAVRFSYAGIEPFFGAAVRFTIAAALLFLLALIRRVPLPRGRAALGTLVYGLLAFGLAYALVYYALIRLAAGTTSVILASVPLLTLIFAVLHGQERLSARGVAGGLLAIAGIALLSAGTMDGDVPLVYFLTAVGAAAATAESSVVAKALPRLDPIVTNGVGMTAGAGLLWIVSLSFGESWALPSDARTWLVLAYLIVFGSVGLFMLFLFVIERWSASATVYSLALMPVVAVTLGSLLANEPITWKLLLGGGLVLAAVYLGAVAKRAVGPASPTPPR